MHQDLQPKRACEHCGAINFVRKFIPNCAEIIRPITELTKRDSSETVKWETEQELAFTKIKQILTTDPVLKLFDIRKEHMLQTDASETAVGGTLLQKEADGTLHPVFFMSVENCYLVRHDTLLLRGKLWQWSGH